VSPLSKGGAALRAVAYFLASPPAAAIGCLFHLQLALPNNPMDFLLNCPF